MKSEILVRRSGSADPVEVAEADSVISSSVGRGWRGLIVEHQALPPTECSGHMAGDLLSIQLGPTKTRHTWAGGRERRRLIRAGDVLFVPADTEFRFAWTLACEVINIQLDPGSHATAAALHLPGDAVITRLGQAMVAALRQPPGLGELLFADSMLIALSAQLASRLGASGPDEPKPLSRQDLIRVRDLVESDLAAPLRVSDLAAVIPMSPAHFSRSFRETVGITPHSYVLRRRIAAARRLLARPSPTVGEVARRTGFADAGHLARVFRRHLDLTPAAYRRQMLR